MSIAESTAGRYRIAETARISGFSPSTLRYYDKVGVLVARDRTPSGYRLYSDRDIELLRLVARAKDLGCTLDEIAELVHVWGSDECGPVMHRLRTLVHDKAAQVAGRCAEQAAFAEELRTAARGLAGPPPDGPCDESCGCIAGNDGDAVPIGCSLSGTDTTARLGDWQRVLEEVASRRRLPDGLRLEFGGRTRVAELAALAEAEQACCPFFSFAITIDQRGLALEVTAPAGGQDLLDAVFAPEERTPDRC